MMKVFHDLNQEKVLTPKGVLIMEKQHVDRRVSVLFAVIIVVSMVLILSGMIFAATILNSKQLPTEQTLKGGTGNEKFNTLRFETYGGQPDNRIIGYFLYKDGIRVSFDGPQLEPIGKLSLNEVFADHERVVKAKFYSRASKLIIREIIRDNKVIGYAVSDLKMEITLWDKTTDPSSISLELRYKDLQAKGERYYGGPR
jgi:hypothetical protein